jgi:hypothetical protein
LKKQKLDKAELVSKTVAEQTREENRLLLERMGIELSQEKLLTKKLKIQAEELLAELDNKDAKLRFLFDENGTLLSKITDITSKITNVLLIYYPEIIFLA